MIPDTGDEPVVAPVITHVSLVTAQLSALVELGVTTLAEQAPGVLVAVMFEGQVIVGGCVSFTVTVNEQVAVFPPGSRTV